MITLSQRRKLALSLGITIVVALAAAVVVAIRDDLGPRPLGGGATPAVLTWTVGACVRRQERALALADCAAASGRVLAIGVRASGAEPRCPADTDEFASITHGRTACVRNLRAPHPGDPGQGGGVLRAGDCVVLRGGEWPCAQGDWYGRVVARAGSARDCPRATLETLGIRRGPVLCLGRGGRVLAPGDCVRRPPDGPADGDSLERDSLVKVSCSSPRAWAEVTARVATRAHCPKRSDQYLLTPGRKPFRAVTCLRAVASA
jgi:hypothetical protein